MIKTILNVIYCFVFSFVIAIIMLFACQPCNIVKADKIRLTNNSENVENADLISTPSVSGYSYTQLLSVVPIRNHLTGGGIQESFENLVFGFMGNTVSLDGQSIITDSAYLDVFTTIIDNESNDTTNNTLYLQRRTLNRIINSNGGVYYLASSNLLSNWYVSLKSTFTGSNYATYTNYKVKFFSLELSYENRVVDLSEFQYVSKVQCFLTYDSSGVTNVYRFYKDGGILIGTANLKLDYIYGGSDFKETEVWVDTSFSININDVLNRHYQDICDSEYNLGREVDYRQGYNDGYSDGEDYGYKLGLEEGANSGDTTSGSTSTDRGISRFFSIELLPNFNIGHLLLLVLGLGIIGLIIYLLLR